ncbi:MAG: septum formation family protein [Propionicimonas sp.]|nr:septum formation family protein [Propionicimonas sp.]
MTGPGRTRAAGCLAAAVAATALGLAGCASDGPRNSAGQVTESSPADAFSLRVGDCTGPLTTGTIEQVVLVPCAEPHSWEAFAATELTGDDFPGAGSVQDQAEEFCNARFKDFVGVSAGKSDYDLTVLQPTRQTWTSAGDRTVTCLAGKDGGDIEGSLKGAGK